MYHGKFDYVRLFSILPWRSSIMFDYSRLRHEGSSIMFGFSRFCHGEVRKCSIILDSVMRKVRLCSIILDFIYLVSSAATISFAILGYINLPLGDLVVAVHSKKPLMGIKSLDNLLMLWSLQYV